MNVIIVIRKSLLGVWEATTYDTSDTKTTAVIAIIEAPEPPPPTRRVKVNVDVLNIRKGPGTEYDRVGYYRRGEIVDILEERLAWGRTDIGWINLAYTVEV